MPYIRGPAAVLIVVLTAGLSIAHLWHPAPAVFADGLSSSVVPRVVAGVASAGDLPLPPEYKSELPGARIISRTYGDGPQAVQFLLLSGNAEAALHDPRQCMTGWRLSDPGSAHIPGTPIVAQTFAGAEAGGAPDVEIAYFYVVDGRFISNPSQIRLSILANAFLAAKTRPSTSSASFSPSALRNWKRSAKRGCSHSPARCGARFGPQWRRRDLSC